ncbi:MAG TPA: hypothetical protein VFU37_05515 [Pyrinomonadaceae bacterium]|nr:hypothetical protein [Pyrinomonadaceae bacterium]
MKMFFFKSRILVSLSVVALFLTASVFARAGKQDFVLHNQTGVEINSLYVSPHDSNDWQEDILGQKTLPNGESVKIAFDNRETKMHWDLKVTDKNGNSLEWDDLNLVAISEVTLHWDPKNNKGWADVK